MGVPFPVMSQSQAGRSLVGGDARYMPGPGVRGRKERGKHEAASNFLPKLGSLNFITVCSPEAPGPDVCSAHSHTRTGAPGLTCALGVRGAGCEVLLAHRAPGWDVSTVCPAAAWSWWNPGSKKSRAPSISPTSYEPHFVAVGYERPDFTDAVQSIL